MSYKKKVCGLDEVGRGALAGPVIVASVVFKSYSNIPFGILDSKKISYTKRESLFCRIRKLAYIGVGIVSSKKIDHMGINAATNLAADLSIKYNHNLADLILIDGNIKIKTKLKYENIFKGDSNYVSIAAASIVAKVTRDQIMSKYSKLFNVYKWEQNKGYGTKEHLLAIKNYGITEYHRKTYKMNI